MSSRKLHEVKTIALIAHDSRKQDMLEWAKFNKTALEWHDVWATGTTGTMLERELKIQIHKLMSGPLGGDQQIGAMIADGKIDVVVFLWDPLAAHPHDVDVKALLRIAAVHNIIIACDRATADFVFSSPLMDKEYVIQLRDYSDYERRFDK